MIGFSVISALLLVLPVWGGRAHALKKAAGGRLFDGFGLFLAAVVPAELQLAQIEGKFVGGGAAVHRRELGVMLLVRCLLLRRLRLVLGQDILLDTADHRVGGRGVRRRLCRDKLQLRQRLQKADCA